MNSSQDDDLAPSRGIAASLGLTLIIGLAVAGITYALIKDPTATIAAAFALLYLFVAIKLLARRTRHKQQED